MSIARAAATSEINAGLPTDSQILPGSAEEVLAGLPGGTFRCCVTSPPYWGLRDYGVPQQIGAEDELEAYIRNLTRVFAEVRRVLTDDGTLWLNLGDSYTSGGRTWRDQDDKNPARGMGYRAPTPPGLKPKDLIGVPWRVAFALQADGWYLRSDIIWHKPNCQPESVKDRPTRCHEYLFLLSKSDRYFYDHAAVREEGNGGGKRNRRTVWHPATENLGSLWEVRTEPYPEAHFAVFPPTLVEPCILAGSAPGDRVLDPFFGSGTVGEVCLKTGRRFTGIELNPAYADLARKRITGFSPRSHRDTEPYTERE